MRVDCALLCDAATSREGLLYILGGGITRAARPQYPAPMGMHLALRILVHPTEAELQHRLRVLVNTDDGQSMAVVEMLINPPPPEARSQLRPGEELSLPLALNLSQVGLPEPRDYSVEILIDGIHQASVPFNVKEASAL